MDGFGCDACVSQRRFQLRIGLAQGLNQSLDLRDEFRVEFFAFVSSSCGEVVLTANASAKFIETSVDGIPSPTEKLFGSAWLSLAVFECHLSLELPTEEPSAVHILSRRKSCWSITLAKASSENWQR